jgi:hypothetical protein
VAAVEAEALPGQNDALLIKKLSQENGYKSGQILVAQTTKHAKKKHM